MVRKHRSINEVEAEYLRNHLDEVDDYITILFDEYAESGDIASLLSSLQSISRIKGIDISDLSHNNAENLLLDEPNTQLQNLNKILQAMGYRLMAQKLTSSSV